VSLGGWPILAGGSPGGAQSGGRAVGDLGQIWDQTLHTFFDIFRTNFQPIGGKIGAIFSREKLPAGTSNGEVSRADN